MKQFPRQDAIDIAIRQNVSEQPGCSISTAIDPLRIELSETALRARAWQMVRRGMLRMERGRHTIKLYAVDMDGKGDAL